MGERLRMCGKERTQNRGTVDWKKAPMMVSGLPTFQSKLPRKDQEDLARPSQEERNLREGQRRCGDSGDGGKAAQDG